MTTILSLAIGALFASAFYNLMRRSLFALALGLVLLGHATNLALFVVNELVRATPPIIPEGQTLPPSGFADPLPQALILTAVVINFGMQAFALVLLHRSRRIARTDDVDQLARSK